MKSRVFLLLFLALLFIGNLTYMEYERSFPYRVSQSISQLELPDEAKVLRQELHFGGITGATLIEMDLPEAYVDSIRSYCGKFGLKDGQPFLGSRSLSQVVGLLPKGTKSCFRHESKDGERFPWQSCTKISC